MDEDGHSVEYYDEVKKYYFIAYYSLTKLSVCLLINYAQENISYPYTFVFSFNYMYSSLSTYLLFIGKWRR